MTKFSKTILYNKHCLSTNRFRGDRESRWDVTYELYIDVLFLVNFMMDYLLLLLIRKMLLCTATHKEIFLGAIMGALLTCIVVVLPIPYEFLKFILFHTIVNTCMIRVGLKIKSVSNFARAYLLLYIGGFLLGGILSAMGQYIKVGSLFVITAVIGYYLANKIWDFVSALQKTKQFECEVELYLKERVCRVNGIIDTGNGLRDPITNQPVSILDRNIARTFLGQMEMSKVRYIPYHSIGKKEGVLLVVKIECMHVYGEKEYVIQSPLIAISEEMISAEGAYQMILNPNIF